MPIPIPALAAAFAPYLEKALVAGINELSRHGNQDVQRAIRHAEETRAKDAAVLEARAALVAALEENPQELISALEKLGLKVTIES